MLESLTSLLTLTVLEVVLSIDNLGLVEWSFARCCCGKVM